MNTSRYQLRIKGYFEAAHSLEWHHKCHVLHGHTYHVEIVVGSDTLDKNGVVVDLGVIQEILANDLPDHSSLNDWIDNPTVERIAEEILYRVQAGLRQYQLSTRLRVDKVTVWESPAGGVTINA